MSDETTTRDVATPAYLDCPTCPACRRPYGTTSLAHGPGRLRCLGCRHRWDASPADIDQARRADAAWTTMQLDAKRGTA